MPASKGKRRQFVWLFVIVCLGVVLWRLPYFLESVPGPYHSCHLALGALSNIRVGLVFYDYAHGCLPPSTAPATNGAASVSWRVEVYGVHSSEEMTDVVYDRRRTWNDPENLRLQIKGLKLFAYQPYYRKWTKPNDLATYYKAITGPDTGFDPEKSSRLSDLPHDLVLVVRVEESPTHWMEPGDLDVEELLRGPNLQSLLASPVGKDGYAVLFADGEAWVLSSDLPWYDLFKFFTVTGASQHDRDQVLGPYRVRPRF